MVTAGEIMTEFVCQEDCQQGDRERQAGQKQNWVVVRGGERSEKGIERSRLIMSVGGGKMSARDQTGEQCDEKQGDSEQKRAKRRMRRGRAIRNAGILRSRPNRRLGQVRGNALLGFRRIHKTLLGGSCGSVFQALQFLSRLKTNGFARRDADLFAGARITADAGLAGFDAEHTELAQFDALPATESVFQ